MTVTDSDAPPARSRWAGPLRVIAPGGWRNALREFSIIVLGVMCALAAQAWWQARQEHELERDYLHQLHLDAKENEARLNLAISADSSTSVALKKLSDMLYRPGPVPSRDSIVPLFAGDAFGSSDFQPLSGTFTALTAAGDLRLIRTDSLRAMIVAYAASLDYERGMLAFYVQQAFGDADRFIRAAPFMHQLFSSDSSAIVRDIEARGTTVEQLRRSVDLAAVLFSLEVANRNRLRHLGDLRNATKRLVETLNAEPGAIAGSR